VGSSTARFKFAQKQQGIHILPFEARTDGQARGRTVSRKHDPDDLAAGNLVVRRDRRLDRLDRRQRPVRVPDRDHRAIHHETREVHHSVSRGMHLEAGLAADVDPAMTGRVRGGRSDIRGRD
jgi:hypothetical protein